MDIDATLLGSGPSRSPRGIGGVKAFTWPVSPLGLAVIRHRTYHFLMCRDSQLFEPRSNLVRDNERGSSRPGVRWNDFEASRMSFILILTRLVPNPAGGAVLNVADTTQEGYYSNRLSLDPFRASFRHILSRHWT